MVGFKLRLHTRKIVYHIHLELKDLIKDEMHYDHLIKQVLRHISVEGKFDLKSVSDLIKDSKHIFSKLHDLRDLMSLELFGFFSELFEYFKIKKVFGYFSPQEIKFVDQINLETKSLRKSAEYIKSQSQKSAHMQKSFEKFFQKFVSDLGLVKNIDQLNEVDFDFDELMGEIQLKGLVCSHGTGRKIYLFVLGMLHSFEEELEDISVSEARKLYELKQIKDALLSVMGPRYLPGVGELIEEISNLMKCFEIELNQEVLDNQKLSEVEWNLLHFKKKLDHQTEKIGYHATKILFVQYAILHNFMFGAPRDEISVTLDLAFRGEVGNGIGFLKVSKKVSESGFEPDLNEIILEFNLNKIRLVELQDHDDAVKIVNMIAEHTLIDIKKYPWYKFKSPVKLTDCLTKNSLKEVMRIKKSMDL
ncbi:hypothetical protein HN587_03550 [Candidatus Woesearchaeota archaeon]|jgi:hypothetical protein|nr:hypothetical protein [Candidatus Woesearchaeota archaeon]